MNAHTTMKSVLVMGLAVMALGTGIAKADDKLIEPAFKRGPVFNDSRFDQDFHRDRDSRYLNQRDMQEEIDQRQDRQMDRILQGLGSGQLTNREAVALLQEQRDLSRIEKRYLADNFLTTFEYRDLDQRLDVASRHILDEKNDRQRDRW